MFLFPRVEPEIIIDEKPGEGFEVECLDSHSLFIPLELGAELEFAFYDYSADSAGKGPLIFSQACRYKITARLSVGEFQALEMETWEAEAGKDYTGPGYRSYKVIKGGDIKASVEFSGRTWNYYPSNTFQFPRHIKPGLVVTGHEHIVLDDGRTYEHELTVKALHAADISVGYKGYRCMKMTIMTLNAGQPDSMAEYYIADSGRTVFFRRYDGPASPRYEERLKDNPTFDYEGTVWRHFYDSIPDHTLVVGL